MRQRFEQQLSLKCIPISEVRLDLKSRDELPPILLALQHIFVTPELNEKVFELLEQKICGNKKKTGRKGMDLWHLFVLAVVRHGCNTNWDTLALHANGLKPLRQIMGLGETGFDDTTEGYFHYQTIIDNVSLLDEELLRAINDIVCETGFKMLKKKDDESIILKTDSYVVETDIHFPTDLNLLWDSVRKCLDTIKKLKTQLVVVDWRKLKYIHTTFKKTYRNTNFAVFKGRKDDKKKASVKEYLRQANEIKSKIDVLLAVIKNEAAGKDKTIETYNDLVFYKTYMEKFIDQIDRRILKGEVIPAAEKVFSIFEDHTEWITKGKLSKNVELGHMVLLTTNQFHFVVDYKTMYGQKDAEQIDTLYYRLDKKYEIPNIKSHSFDKAFFSKENLETLEKKGVALAVLPKKGTKTIAEKERESEPEFKKYRNKHSAIESNINMLEHHGLGRCYDKGLHGFERCVGLSVLSYNLHILGNAIKSKEIKKKKKAKKLLKAG